MNLFHFPTAPAHPRTAWDSLHLTAVAVLPRMLRLLGVKRDDVADLSQDVLLAAYRNLDRFNPWYFHGDRADVPGEPCDARNAETRWLFAIAWRQVSHYLDRAHRRREIPAGLLMEARFQYVDAMPSTEVGATPSADEGIAARERLELTARLLDSVAPERRVILVLSDAYDVPVAEIAKLLGINVNTAFSRLRLAREEYRAAVKRLGAEDRQALRSGLLLVPPISAVFFANEGAGESDGKPTAPQSALEVEPPAQGNAGAPRKGRRALVGLGRGLWPIAAGIAAATALVLALEPKSIPWARHFGMPARHLAMAHVALPAKAAADANAGANATVAAAGADAGAVAAVGSQRESSIEGRARSEHGRDTLGEEQRQLAAAPKALARGDFAATLALLAAQEQRFPHGRLRQTRAWLRASVLAAYPVQTDETDGSPNEGR